MSTRQKQNLRWPRIALSVVDRSEESGERSVDLRHHTTRPSIYTLYRQPQREPKKIDRHGAFIEDAHTRMLSAEFGKHVVKDETGDYWVFPHWGWPPMPLTFDS